jgi:hypothetical protein
MARVVRTVALAAVGGTQHGAVEGFVAAVGATLQARCSGFILLA